MFRSCYQGSWHNPSWHLGVFPSLQKWVLWDSYRKWYQNCYQKWDPYTQFEQWLVQFFELWGSDWYLFNIILISFHIIGFSSGDETLEIFSTFVAPPRWSFQLCATEQRPDRRRWDGMQRDGMVKRMQRMVRGMNNSMKGISFWITLMDTVDWYLGCIKPCK